jgi:hypothetical protein
MLRRETLWVEIFCVVPEIRMPVKQERHHLVAHLFLVGKAVSVFRALRRKQ